MGRPLVFSAVMFMSLLFGFGSVVLLVTVFVPDAVSRTHGVRDWGERSP